MQFGYSTGEPARLLAVADAPAWNDVGTIPSQLIRRANELGLARPSLDQWRALTAAQRYTLSNLARDGHESPNYLLALQEFALI
jgi:hypothetical protein